MLYRDAVDRSGFKRLARYVHDRDLRHPAYYRIGGRPVFAIYDLTAFGQGLEGLKPAAEALSWFREEAPRAGLPGLHLQCRFRDSGFNVSGVNDSRLAVSQEEAVRTLGFDSLTHYPFSDCSQRAQPTAEASGDD